MNQQLLPAIKGGQVYDTANGPSGFGALNTSLTSILNSIAALEGGEEGGGYLPTVGGALADGANIALGTSIGTQIGTDPIQKLGFYGSAPCAQFNGSGLITSLSSLGLVINGTIGVGDVGSLSSYLNNLEYSLSNRLNSGGGTMSGYLGMGSNQITFSGYYISLAANVANTGIGTNGTFAATTFIGALTGTASGNLPLTGNTPATIITASAEPLAIVTNSTPTTGQTVSASTAKQDELCYINPAGTLNALTISMPTAANSRVGQIERFFCTRIITTLTVSVSGSGTVVGSAPVTVAANWSVAYQCVSTASTGTWVRLY